MDNPIIYRHWQPGDDDAVLAFRPNTNEEWYRQKFDDGDLEPEGIRLAFLGERVAGHVMGESTSLFIEGKTQRFGTVTDVFVAPDMRRQGIATRLMQEIHTHFESKDYRGSVLDTDTEEARQLYQKVGYQEVARELQARLLPSPNASRFKWKSMHLEDLSILRQLDQRWARQNFRVWWKPGSVKVDPSNLNEYRVLRSEGDIIGYAKWSEWPEPLEGYPHGLICDPIVPDQNPMEVIKSLQAAISAPLIWETCEGSRYEKPLRSIGCSLERTRNITMLFSFGNEINVTGQFRTFS